MFPIDKLPGRTIIIDQEEWLYASGTSYLGIAQDPDFKELLLKGIDRFGLHYGGSRLASIKLGIFEEAEEHLARLTGAESAVVLSSGTLAGQLTSFLLIDEGRSLMAPETHPALWGDVDPMEGSRTSWIRRVLDNASRWEGGLVLYSNALDAMRARAYDFSWLGDLPGEVPITLVVDDSHAIGIRGTLGGGSYRTLQSLAPKLRVVVTGSLGKAFGVPAGFIAGDTEVIESVRDSPFYGGASPPTPAWLYAFVQGEEFYHARREVLRARIRQFQEATRSMDLFQFIPNFPVCYCEDPDLSDYFELEKILISSFPYPTSEDVPLQRVILNALHTEADIDYLISATQEFATGRE